MAKEKTRRRVKGEGSIQQRPDGSWFGYLTLGNGKRKYVYGKTQTKVSKELTKLRNDQLDGKSLESSNVTVEAYAARWLEDTDRLKVRHNTYSRHESLLRVHIYPHIGNVKLSKLTTTHINAMQTALEKADPPVGEHSRQSVHKLLNTILKHALATGAINRNPCTLANKPKPKPRKYVTLSGTQLATFCKAAQGSNYSTLLILAAVTGMRQGEVLGLQWDDIDLDAGTLKVNRTLSQKSRHEFLTLPPKTKTSKRTVPIPAIALAGLNELKLYADEHRPEEAFVFVWKDGGPVPKQNIRLVFKNVLEAAGLPKMRFHDLRHSVGTLLMESGENPKIVSELLGHSSVSITLDIYSHVSPSMTRAASDKLGKLAEPEIGCK